MGGGDRRYDARYEVVLHVEDGVRPERTVVGLRPEMRTVRGIDELCRHPQLRSRLPDAAFDDVAGANLTGNGADVGRRAGETRGRAPGDDAEV